ncbi:MAG TPA: hypothetical protein VH681_03785 [Nitrospiraceae bacterium]|jgi:hypothetical protein
MNGTLFIGSLLLMIGWVMPALGEESLLYETWHHSSFEPDRLDAFLQSHSAEYTADYFKCSQEAQRLIRDEATIRNRRCEFSGDSVLRNTCRQENYFRGLDKQLAELDQAIQNHKPWLDLESGRNAVTAVRAADEFDKSCTPPTCDIAKRKKTQRLRDLKPYLQCPPIAERPSDVDPSFKSFTLPEDPGG